MRGESLLSPVWSRVSNIVAERASGSWIFDTTGKKWLDFTTGIAVCNTGHSHPRVVRAASEQLGKMIHAQMNIVRTPVQMRLAEKLEEIMPHKSLDSFFFSNSGAEAIEGAVKLAKHATGKRNVICFEGSFHGRTLGALSMTSSKYIYSKGVGGHIGGVYFARFPYSVKYGRSEEEAAEDSINHVKDILKMYTCASDTAAILIEPILGEGGYVVSPNGFLAKLRKLCDDEKILVILDEVQSGFGRTGSWFAANQLDTIRPDIMVMAKGIASGLPLSAIAANRSLMEKWTPGSHGGTYGGNTVACAAACETIDVIRDEKLMENAQARGQQLRSRLLEWKNKKQFPILDVRGLGLMSAVEFDPAMGGIAGRVVSKALDHGLLLMTSGARETIRFMPPLVVTEEEVDIALSTMEKAMTEASAK